MKRKEKNKPFVLERPIPLKYFSVSSMLEPPSPFYPLNLIFLFVPAMNEGDSIQFKTRRRKI